MPVFEIKNWLQAPYFPFMQSLLQALKQQPHQLLVLEPEAYDHFACSGCAQCCQRPWLVDVTAEYYQQWLEIFDKHPSGRFQQPFTLTPQNKHYAEIRKKPGTHECLFLQDDRSCFIQSNYGEAALPLTCQRFPRYEGWFGAYLGRFFLNSCPDVSALVHTWPRIAYGFLPILNLDWWRYLQSQQAHPLGVDNGVLWLGFQLDLLHETAATWTPIQSLRYLGTHLRRLEPGRLQETSADSLKAGYHDLLNTVARPDLSPISAAQPQAALDGLYQFLQHFPALQAFLQQMRTGQKNPPVLSVSERTLLNRFLKDYLFYRFCNLICRLPTGQAVFFQAYFLLALHVSLVQWAALFYRERDGCALNLDQLSRAVNLVGFRFEHAPEFARAHGIYQLPARACLEGFDALLSFDFGSVEPVPVRV